MFLLRLLFLEGNRRWQHEKVWAAFDSVRAQIPALYIACIVNLIGISVALPGYAMKLALPLSILSALFLWRAAHWRNIRNVAYDHDVARTELTKVARVTLLLCLGFSAWAQLLMTTYPQHVLEIAIFNLLSALSVAYGLSSFPRAAILPLAIVSLPLALRMLLGDDNITRALGLSLLLVILLFVRLLRNHARALSDLIDSELSASRERNRAMSAEQAAVRRANDDCLTGLANRSGLIREIEGQLLRTAEGAPGGVVGLCDLDGFKRANDVFGHAAGDAILKAFGERLKRAFGEQAFVARIGGDEFAVFWKNGLCANEISAAGERICELARQPVEWMGKGLTVSTSCGFNQAGRYSDSIDGFLRQADAALYMAKTAGSGCWRLYDQAADVEYRRRTQLEALLLEDDIIQQFEVNYQPIYTINENRMIFVEALARWKHLDLGIVEPREFISLAETLGRIEVLNETLLNMALRQVSGWNGDVGLAFNLSAAQVSCPGAADRLLQSLERHGVAPARLMFEISEAAVLPDLLLAQTELQKLRDAGCLIALDDFGASQASVPYLRSFEVDVVKLDGALTKSLRSCARSRQILLGLINLTHATGALCVAEHIESQEQLELVSAMGCDMVQGFLLSHPVMAEQVHELPPLQPARMRQKAVP